MSNKDKDDKEKLAPVSLATMVGQGDIFEAANKRYTVKPLKLKHVPEFLEDNISIGSQLFNLANEEARMKLEKWIPLIIFDGGESLTLQRLIDDDWDLNDLKALLRKTLDISG